MAPVIIINNETSDVDISSVSKLSDLIDKVARELLEPREIITEVYVDGRTLGHGDFGQKEDCEVSSCSEISFVTLKEPEEKVASLLDRMSDYLDGFPEGLGKVADQFRMGNPEEANKVLLQALEGLSAFVELLSTVRLVASSDLSNIKSDTGTLAEKEENFLEITTNMASSQEEKDWITVADLLEYELAPLMTDWKAMIPQIRSEVLKAVE